MSDRDLKLKLFSYYATNLSIYHPEYRDQFMCPACKKVFSREDLFVHPPKISLAHAPPSSIGGKLVTLACTKCDNEIGKCDRQVKYEKDAIEDFENGIVRDAVMVSSKGTRLPCRLEIKDKSGEIKVIVVNKPGMPLEHYRKIAKKFKDDYLSGAPYDGSIETISHKREPDKWLISQIYSALLIMFYHLGYEYVLNSNANGIREALENDRDILKYKNSIISIHEKTSPEKITRPTIGILTNPKNMQCFIIEIPSPKKDEASRTIALPGFGEKAKHTYENLMNLPYDANLNFTCKAIEFKKPGEILPDSNSKGFGERLWNNVTC